MFQSKGTKCQKSTVIHPKSFTIIIQGHDTATWLSVSWDTPVQSCAHIKITDLKLLAPALRKSLCGLCQNTIP